MQTYETKGGELSAGDTYAKIIEYITLLEEQCYILGHYYKAQDDWHKGQGFLAVGEMMKMFQIHVTDLATGKLRREGGFR